MHLSFQTTRKNTVFPGSSLQVGCPCLSSPLSLPVTGVVDITYCSLPLTVCYELDVSPIPNFWKCSTCQKRTAFKAQMMYKDNRGFTGDSICSIRGSQGKCLLAPSGNHLHVAPTTSQWQSNRNSICISTELKYCIHTGQMGTSSSIGLMPTSIYPLLIPVLWLAWDKDIFIIRIKQDLPTQK